LCCFTFGSWFEAIPSCGGQRGKNPFASANIIRLFLRVFCLRALQK